MKLIPEKRSRLLIYWSIFSLVLAIVILREMLFNPGVPITRDLVFPIDLSTMDGPFDAWNDSASMYNPEINKSPLYAILLASSNAFGTEATIKSFFVLVIFLLSFVPFTSIYLLFREKIKSIPKLAVVCGLPALLYTLNPWVVDRISNHIYMVFGMAITPLLIVLFVRLIEGRRPFASTVLAGFVIALVFTVASFSTHNLLYLVPLLLLISIFYLATARKSNRKHVIITTVVVLALFAGLNAYWIMPNAIKLTSSNVQPSYDFSILEVERLSKLGTPANSIQMSGGGAWKEVILNPPNTAASLLLFSIVPIFSLASIAIFRRNRFVLLLGVLFILLFPLSLGTNSPIPVFDWLLDSPIGGLVWLFRDPFRIVQFVVLIFAFMLAFTISRITQIKKPEAKAILVFAMAAGILYSPASYTFFNSAGNRLIPSQIPTEYAEVGRFLENDNGSSFRVLWFPLRQYQFYEWNKVDSEVAGDVYSVSSPVPTYGLTTTASYSQFWTYVYHNLLLDFRTENIGKVLAGYDIKYVVVHTDLLGWQNNEATKALKVLNLQDDLQLVKSLEDYHIFRNLSYVDQGSKFSIKSVASYAEDQGVQLLPDNVTLDIINPNEWQKGPRTDLVLDKSEADPLLRWDVAFSTLQERYEVKLPLSNIDIENFDKISVNVLPVGSAQPMLFALTLYTNGSNFQFTHYSLSENEWNNEIFDLRAAKLTQATRSNELNLRNVTALGLVVYKQYYPEGSYSFYIKDIQFIPDPIRLDSAALLDSLSYDSASAETPQIIQDKDDRIHLSVTDPVILVYDESYDPLWKARISDGESSIVSDPLLVNFMQNGFMITEPGEYDIHVFYAGQEWIHYGAIISLVTIALVCIYSYRSGYWSKTRKPNEVISVPQDSSFTESFSPDIQDAGVPRHSSLWINRISLIIQSMVILALFLLAALPISILSGVSESIDGFVLSSVFLLTAGIVSRFVLMLYENGIRLLDRIPKVSP